jgi:hypothetical protein
MKGKDMNKARLSEADKASTNRFDAVDSLWVGRDPRDLDGGGSEPRVRLDGKLDAPNAFKAQGSDANYDRKGRATIAGTLPPWVG